MNIRTNELPSADGRGVAAMNLAEIPKAGSFDVVVVGGGTGGAPAAIVAGQEGLKTAVIEPQGFLGGIGTGGGIHMYYHGIQTGVQIAIDARTDQWTDRIGGKASGFHPEAKKLALQGTGGRGGCRVFLSQFLRRSGARWKPDSRSGCGRTEWSVLAGSESSDRLHRRRGCCRGRGRAIYFWARR